MVKTVNPMPCIKLFTPLKVYRKHLDMFYLTVSFTNNRYDSYSSSKYIIVGLNPVRYFKERQMQGLPFLNIISKLSFSKPFLVEGSEFALGYVLYVCFLFICVFFLIL